MKQELLKTADGSYTLYVPEIDETYHSRNGAFNESVHVFIQNGLNLCKGKTYPIRILEVGFGTGLNALLTYNWSIQNNIEVSYLGLEPYRINTVLLQKIKKTLPLDTKDLYEYFELLHTLESGTTFQLKNLFSCTIVEKTLQDFNESRKFDLVYYDAFAPAKQPEMWSMETLQHVVGLMDKDAVLTTYCASGRFKRTLKELGLELRNPPGPNGKREMTIGVKKF